MRRGRHRIRHKGSIQGPRGGLGAGGEVEGGETLAGRDEKGHKEKSPGMCVTSLFRHCMV